MRFQSPLPLFITTTVRRSLSPLFLALLLPLLAGCLGDRAPIADRHFQFGADTFAYANELVNEYYFDDHGKWRSRRREPQQDYTHHCFVVARSARQFFQHARFDPSLPRVDDTAYRSLIRRVVNRDPARQGEERVVIPGYASLREFSADREKLLKESCGGAWQSYLQRGNWRVTMPFTKPGQAIAARRLFKRVQENRPPVVHLITFPNIKINHAILLYDAVDRGDTIEFKAYDPNDPKAPVLLTYHGTTRTFTFPGNDYFIGGKVHVYEIYRSPIF